MKKAADAFRSIGEVSQLIGVAPHVLRYWESQFPLFSPVKRRDGRRYYRPDDIKLAAGLCEILREEGVTIRGAKKQMAADRGAALKARGAARLGGDFAAGAAPEAAAPPPAARPKPAGDSTLPLFPDLAPTAEAPPVQVADSTPQPTAPWLARLGSLCIALRARPALPPEAAQAAFAQLHKARRALVS